MKRKEAAIRPKLATMLAAFPLVLIIVLSTILIPFLLAVPLVTAEPGLSYPPHEEPGTASNIIDPVSILTYMSGILNLMSQKDYESAKALMAQYNLTSLPSGLSPLFSNYVDHTSSANDNVQKIDQLVNETSALLDRYDTSGANQTLSQVSITIGQTEILVNELGSTSASVGDSLGVSSSPQGSASATAYADLQASNQKFSDLVDYYLKLLLAERARLMAEEAQIQNGTVIIGQNGTTSALLSTSLTLYSSVTEAWLGDYLQLYGTLVSNGSGLTDKNVTILMDGNDIGSAITGVGGNFSLSFQMPFLYEDSALLVALYIPAGRDAAVYWSSQSQPLAIQLLYHRANLVFDSPAVANPGTMLAVWGDLTFDGVPMANIALQIYLDGAPVASAVSSPNGSFASNFTLDPLTVVGVHQLTASVLPSGLYGGANQTNPLDVVKMPVSVSISYPGIVLMPGRVTIAGNLTSPSSSAPINATVVVTLGGTAQVVSTANGTFSSSFDLPLSLWLLGFQRISVNATPSEPWYSQSQATGQVLVVNPASVAALVFAAAAVAVFSFLGLRRYRKSGGTPAAGAAIGQVPPPPPPSSFPPGVPGVSEQKEPYDAATKGLGGLNGSLQPGRHRVLESYLRAAGFIEARTGIRMEVDMTINEFMRMTTPGLDGVAYRFVDLTLLAERSLYSQREPTPQDASAAEDCTKSLLEQLGDGGQLRDGNK